MKTSSSFQEAKISKVLAVFADMIMGNSGNNIPKAVLVTIFRLWQ